MLVVPKLMHSTSAMQAVVRTKILLIFNCLHWIIANKAAPFILQT